VVGYSPGLRYRRPVTTPLGHANSSTNDNIMFDLKFIFGEPRHGWMEITIDDSKKKVKLDISDVPCNSILRLAKILLKLLDGSLEEDVEFSLEPEYALWKFKVVNDNLQIDVFPNAARDNPIVFRKKKNKALNRLYKGLRDLEAMSCWKKHNSDEDVWSWDFPSVELAQFKRRRNNTCQKS